MSFPSAPAYRAAGRPVATGVPQFVFQIACLTFGVFMLGQAGAWFFKTTPGIVSPVWPSAGFALAAALIYGLDRTIPAIYLGTLASSFLIGESTVNIYVGPIGSVLETIVGYYVVRNWAKLDTTLPGLHDFVRFVIAGCLPGPAVAALFSVVIMHFSENPAASQLNADFFDTWQAHAFGTLVFGSFFLFALRRQDFRPMSAAGRLALFGCSVLLWSILALLLMSGARNSSTSALLLACALLLALLVSLLFGLRTATLFQAMFVFLVPACVVIFESWAKQSFRFGQAPDQRFLINGLAFFSSLGCLLLAAFRDELASLSIKFNLALESADLCVWEWTPAGWCCRAPAWKEKFGIAPDTIVPDETFLGLIHPDDREGFEESFAALEESPLSRWNHTYRMRNSEGEWVWLHSQARPVRHTADDTLAMVTGVTRDITDERDALQNRIDAIETDAELKTLRSQLNPHFLFNALNSVRALIGRRDESARAMITSLGNLLRELLINRDGKLQTVAREMEMVGNYLDIEVIRFGERLRQEVYCEPAASTQRIPGMLILTMVENAVKHGLSQLDTGGRIMISISRDEENDLLVISIVNDGHLMEGSGGFGLPNCRRRISLVSEGKGTLDLQELPGPLVEARATLPWDHRLDT